MAIQHRCRRHGRPAVASRVGCCRTGRGDGILCEIDLAEERLSNGFGGGRSLFDDFFSDFFDPPPAAGSRWRRGGRSAARAPGRAGRRHGVLQRRDARVAATSGAHGARLGEPRPRHGPPAPRRAAGQRRPPCPGADRRRRRRDRRAGRGRGGPRRAHRRCGRRFRRTRKLRCSPRTRSPRAGPMRTSGRSTCSSRSPATPSRTQVELLERFGVTHTKLRGAVIRGVESGGEHARDEQDTEAR